MTTSDSKKLFKTFVRALTASAVLLLAACASTPPGATVPSEQDSGNATAAPEQAADVEIIDSFEGDGLEIPLDGSSLAAFEASMARVKRHSSEADYTALENAIEYLLVYDIAIKRNKEELAAKLDGLNGYQVIAKVAWTKPTLDKSKAAKDAPGAMIET